MCISPRVQHNVRSLTNEVLREEPGTSSDSGFSKSKTPAQTSQLPDRTQIPWNNSQSFTSLSSGEFTPIYNQHLPSGTVIHSRHEDSMSSLGSSTQMTQLSTTPTIPEDSITDTSTCSVNSYKHSVSSGSIKMRPHTPEDNSIQALISQKHSTWNFNSENTVTERTQCNHQVKTIKSYVSMERQGPKTPTTSTKHMHFRTSPLRSEPSSALKSPLTRRVPSTFSETSEAESDTLDKLVVNQNIGEFSDIEISDYENICTMDGNDTTEGDVQTSDPSEDESAEMINTYRMNSSKMFHGMYPSYGHHLIGLTNDEPQPVTSLWNGQEERETTPTPDNCMAEFVYQPVMTSSGVTLREKKRDYSSERRRSIKQLVNSFDSMASPFC